MASPDIRWTLGDFGINFPNGRSYNERRWNFSIVDIPVRGGIKLAFSYRALIGFGDAGRWTLLENDWNPTTRKHVDYLIGILQNVVVVSPKEFYLALNDMLEHPRILLDLAAREARDSMKDL